MTRTKQLKWAVMSAIEIQSGMTRMEIFRSVTGDFGGGWSSFKRVLSLLVSEDLVEVGPWVRSSEDLAAHDTFRLTPQGIFCMSPENQHD